MDPPTPPPRGVSRDAASTPWIGRAPSCALTTQESGASADGGGGVISQLFSRLNSLAAADEPAAASPTPEEKAEDAVVRRAVRAVLRDPEVLHLTGTLREVHHGVTKAYKRLGDVRTQTQAHEGALARLAASQEACAAELAKLSRAVSGLRRGGAAKRRGSAAAAAALTVAEDADGDDDEAPALLPWSADSRALRARFGSAVERRLSHEPRALAATAAAELAALAAAEEEDSERLSGAGGTAAAARRRKSVDLNGPMEGPPISAGKWKSTTTAKRGVIERQARARAILGAQFSARNSARNSAL